MFDLFMYGFVNNQLYYWIVEINVKTYILKFIFIIRDEYPCVTTLVNKFAFIHIYILLFIIIIVGKDKIE